MLAIPCQIHAVILNIPGDFETIQTGIEAAEDEDIVLVAPGEYDENLDFLGKAIRVTSHIHLEGDPQFIENTTIDGGRRDCVVAFNNEEGRNSILRGFTIRNGLQGFGGGIDCQNNSSPLLTDLIVTGNEAQQYGGGIYFSTNATPLITNSIIERNTAPFGAGLSSLRFARATFINVIIRNNAASRNGGGIYTRIASLELDHVAIVENEARENNGGIYIDDSVENIFRNVTLAANESEGFDALSITNATEVVITSCIVWDHDAPSILFHSDQETDFEITFCDIESGEDELILRGQANLIWGEGNFSEDPGFINPEEGDYHINAESPCIDAGNPEDPEDPDWTRADIGAFYFDQRDFLEDVPDIDVQWEIGQDNNIIAWDSYYDEIYLDGEYSIPVLIRNRGAEELVVNGFFFDNNVFSADPQELRLESREIGIVNIIFTPDEIGNFDGVLVIESNDPDEGEVEIELFAVAASPPIIVVNLEEVVDELNSGETFSQELVITNEGETDLNWQIERELLAEPEPEFRQNGPLRDDMGDLLDEFNVPISHVRGIAWDGELMWAVSNVATPGYLFAIDPFNHEIVRNIRLEISPTSIEWDGENFLITNESGDVTDLNYFDTEGQLQNTEVVAVNELFGIAFNQDNLLITTSTEDQSFHIVDYNNLEVIEVIEHDLVEDLPNGARIGSLAWVPGHDDGNLWISYRDNDEYMASQLTFDNNWNFAINHSFRIGLGPYYLGFEHDGRNFWSAGHWEEYMWMILDDGIHEYYWFEVDNFGGTLEQDEEQNVTVTLDAASLIGGEYRGILTLTSNDPDDSEIEISIELDINAVADLEVRWENGNEDGLINFNDYFDEVYDRGEYSVPITFRNLGSDVLVVDEFEFENQNFETDPPNFELDGLDRITVNVVFSPDEVGVIESRVIIHSNDPDEDEFEIILMGEVTEAPDIELAPVVFEAEIQTDDRSAQDIVIRNVGVAPLNWSTDKDIVAEPNRDIPEPDQQLRVVRTISEIRTKGESVSAKPPHRDDPGDHLGFYNMQWELVLGLDIDGDWIWGTSHSARLLWAFDRRESEIVRRFNMGEERLYGMSFDGENIWVLRRADDNVNTSIQIYSRDGELLNQFDVEWERGYFITHDSNNNYYIYSYREEEIRVFSPEHEVLGTIPIFEDLGFGGFHLYGLEWVESHRDGHLWAQFQARGNGPDRLSIQVAIDEAWHAQEVQRIFNEEFIELRGLTHDGKNLILFGRDYHPRKLVVIDDGIEEPYWISLEPSSGIIEGGDEIVADIIFDSEDLIEGEYGIILHFLSNDPDNPIVDVEISMNIIGSPQIEVEWEERMDDNLMLWDDYYDFVFIDQRYTIPLTIRNPGSSVLDVPDINFDNEAFSAEPAQFEIEPREELEIDIIFSPDEIGLQIGRMTINSNDPENDELVINLMGRAFAPPEIVVEPEEIETDILRGDDSEHVFLIVNEGEFALHWNIDIELPEELDFEPGDVIRSYDIPARRTEGLAWDGELMWGVEVGGDVFALDPENGEIVHELQIRGSSMCIAYDGQNLILGGQNGARNTEIREFDREGNLLESWEWDAPFYSLAADQNGHLLLQLTARSRIEVVNIQTHQSVDNFSTDNIFDRSTRRMTWVPEHPDGQLWFLAEGKAYQLYIDDEWDEMLVQTIDTASDDDEIGIGHDGENLWHGMRGEEDILYVIHDGIDEIPLISFDPAEGVLGIDQDDEITININTEQIREAVQYIAIMHVLSNDPANDDIEIEITINVLAHPVIEVNPIPEPQRQAQPIQFPDAIVGDLTEEIVVTISNTGIDELEIIDVILNNEDDFSTDLEGETIIESDETIQAIIAFDPSEAGNRNGELHLFTNAPNVGAGDDVGHLWFELDGTGLFPAQIETDPDPDGEISVLIFVDDDPINRTLSISNASPDGGADLSFDIRAIEVFEENEEIRDGNPARNVRSTTGVNFGPNRDDPGDLLEQFEVPYRYTSGMTWDGELMWGVAYRDDNLWAVNPINGELELDIQLELEEPTGITFDGENLWIGFPGTTTIGIFDRNGDQLDMFDSPVAGALDFASDWDDDVYLCARNVHRIYVMSIAEQEIVTDFPIRHAVDENEIRYIYWVPEHPAGQLWVSGNRTAYQIFVDKYNGENRLDWVAEPVQNFSWEPENGNSPGGIAHDGENFWHAVAGDPIWYVRDDGVLEQHELDWLTVEPESGSIESGGRIEITLSFDPEWLDQDTNYPGEIRIVSNDLDNPLTTIPITLSTTFELRHFNELSETDSQHNLIVTSLMLGDEEALTGCEIGVFTTDDILAGAAIWDEAIIIEVYGDDQETEEVEGFVPQGEFNFRIWDDFSDTEWEYVEAVFEDGPEVWQENGQSSLSINGNYNRELILHLVEGWNMLSINVDPQEFYQVEDDPGPWIQSMFEQIRIDDDNHRIRVLKNTDGQFWAPGFGFSNLFYWILTEGYQVNTAQTCDLVINGLPIPYDIDIPMDQRWNIIAYFPQYELDVSAPEFYGFSSILDFLIIAKDSDGRFIATPFDFSNMPPLRETQGYQLLIDSEEEIVLNYPAIQEEIAFSTNSSSRQDIQGEQAHWLSTPTGQNMSVLVISERGKQFANGDQIAAFDIEGRIVGVGNVDEDGRCGLAIWGDDQKTREKDGLLNADKFELRLWESNNNIVFDVHAVNFLESDALVYSTDAFIALEVTAEREIPNNYELSEAFPNPFNTMTSVSISLPEESMVSVQIFDLSGRLVYTLLNELHPAGRNSISWNSRDASSGVYMIRMKTPDFCSVRKIVLMR